MKKVHCFALMLVTCVIMLFQPVTTPAVALDTGPGFSICMNLATIATPAPAIAAATMFVLSPTMQTDEVTVANDGFLDILKANWLELLLGLLALWEIIARLTPTTVDNSIISWITKLLNLIFPNKKTGGGIIVPLVKSQAQK